MKGVRYVCTIAVSVVVIAIINLVLSLSTVLVAAVGLDDSNINVLMQIPMQSLNL